MNYAETLQYLYVRTPAFHRVGAGAYKPGLERSRALDDALGQPAHAYPVIHVAGTNGKGSVSHLLAATLQAHGLRTGLYTSPHLIDFSERIRVDGQPIPQQRVVDFVAENAHLIDQLEPSFFELTSAMAFDYFRRCGVDIAVIETGLGGRLDSTNIVTPCLSVITNVSLDHTQYLGDTLAQIAAEKAGIIKPGVPVVVGEAKNEDVRRVFCDKAEACDSPVFWAEEEDVLRSVRPLPDGRWEFESTEFGALIGELGGSFQVENARTVLTALDVFHHPVLRKVSPEAVRRGFGHVVEMTGLAGRWQTIACCPTIVCDSGHNVGAWTRLRPLLDEAAHRHARLHMVVGMSSDKDIATVLRLMPPHATYFFTQADTDRALSADELAKLGAEAGLQGTAYDTVPEAIRAAQAEATADDMIFVGGSHFVLADALPLLTQN